MSYGKWKALNPHTEIAVEEEPVQMTERLCCLCGKPIPRSYKGKLYCGEECADEANRARTREYMQRKRERMRANELV